MPRCRGPPVSHQRCSDRRALLKAYRATLSLAIPPGPSEFDIRLAQRQAERLQAQNNLYNPDKIITPPEPPRKPILLRTALIPFPSHPWEITLAIASHLSFGTLRSLASTSHWYRAALTPQLLRHWFDNFRYRYVAICACGGWRGMLAPDEPLGCGEECSLRLCINECGYNMDSIYKRKEWVYWLAHFLVVTGYNEREGEEGMQRRVNMAFRGDKGGLWAIEMLREVLAIRDTFKGRERYTGPDSEFPMEETDTVGHLYYDYMDEDSNRGVEYRRRELEMIKAICGIAEKPLDYLGVALYEEIFALAWDVGHVDMLRYLFDSGRLDHSGLCLQGYASKHINLPRQPRNWVHEQPEGRNPFLWHRSIINAVAAVNFDWDKRNPAPVFCGPRRQPLLARVVCTETSTSLWLNNYWEILDLMIEKHPEMVNWRMQYDGVNWTVNQYREHFTLDSDSIFTFDAAALALEHGAVKAYPGAGEEPTRKLLGKLHAAGADFSLALKKCFSAHSRTSPLGVHSRLEFQFKKWIPLLFEYGAKPDDIIPKSDEPKLKWTPLHPSSSSLGGYRTWSDDIFHMFLDAGYSGIAVPIGVTADDTSFSFGPTALEYIIDSCLRTRSGEKAMFLQCLDVLLRKRPACLDLPEWKGCLSNVRHGAQEELSMGIVVDEEEDEVKPGRSGYGNVPRKPSDYGSVLQLMEAAAARRG